MARLKNFLLAFALLLFVFFLVGLDRFFLKKNHGFCLHYILSPLTYNVSWDISAPFPKKVFDQPFFYLGKGSQSFVFESQDHKYVIKFYKFPSHMRQIPWLKHPLAYHFDKRRLKVKEHNEKRFRLSFESYRIAFEEFAEEAALVYIHLNPTNHLQQTITLVDKLSSHYQIPLDTTGFILQKKAQLLFTVLEEAIQSKNFDMGKKIIDGVLELITLRCQKGIIDLDTMLHKNCGWLDEKVILIDVGRLRKDPSLLSPSATEKELVHATQILKEYLENKSPELFTYLQRQLKNNERTTLRDG